MELKTLMKDAGIVGAGGAGFPSYAKLAGGADTLLINGAECEPLLYTDYIILKHEAETVLRGILAVIDELNIQKALLCIKEHTAKRLSFEDGALLSGKVSVKVLKNVYPAGDEINLIHQATGRLIKPGNLPISKGVIVYNVETMYNLGAALLQSRPVTEKWFTVGGDIPNAFVAKAPIGAKISDILDKLGISVPDGYSVIDGGPSMGNLVDVDKDVITKTTKAILILPNTSRAVESKLINPKMAISRAETACCQCTRCTDMCPRALLGYPLEPHKMVRTSMTAAVTLPSMVLSATLCCGCGVCESLACSQGISPKSVINSYKALLSKNKMKYISDKDVTALPEREYRLIPSEKWAATLGVLRFDKLPKYIGKISDIKSVEIPLNRHIGAPSVPTVKDGDAVCAGDIIAMAGEGLSVPQHATLPGKAILCSDKIIIKGNE